VTMNHTLLYIICFRNALWRPASDKC